MSEEKEGLGVPTDELVSKARSYLDQLNGIIRTLSIRGYDIDIKVNKVGDKSSHADAIRIVASKVINKEHRI